MKVVLERRGVILFFNVFSVNFPKTTRMLFNLSHDENHPLDRTYVVGFCSCSVS
jgi:hypothetical protein